MIGQNSLQVLGRRRFLGVAAGALATTQLSPGANAGVVLDGSIELAQSEAPASLSSLKQIDAGVLNVGYAEAGPIDGPVAILLHGWPYDIHSFVEVTPRLASAGFRVIVPFARGYGSTSFLSKMRPPGSVYLMALVNRLRRMQPSSTGLLATWAFVVTARRSMAL